MSLADFLLARISEDEEEAHRIQAAYEADELRVSATLVNAGAVFIPARVLRECAAKRRIVQNEIRRGVGPASHYVSTEVHEAIRSRLVTDNLQALAALYADHPDYRDEWRQ